MTVDVIHKAIDAVMNKVCEENGTPIDHIDIVRNFAHTKIAQNFTDYNIDKESGTTLSLYLQLIGRNLNRALIAPAELSKFFEQSFRDSVMSAASALYNGVSDDLLDILDI